MSEWISVKDKVPELMSYVLTYAPSFALPITTQLYGRQVTFGGEVIDGFQMRDGRITHWMPLPEPPKVMKEEAEKMNHEV